MFKCRLYFRLRSVYRSITLYAVDKWICWGFLVSLFCFLSVQFME